MNEQLLEIAEYCKQEVEKECKTSDRYGYEIKYVAIFEDSSIRISQTPHILKEASQCLLIHKWMQRASTNYYSTYRVQHIKEDGSVLLGMLDEDYTFGVYSAGFNRSAQVHLEYKGNHVYEKSLDYNVKLENVISFVWALYLKCKSECKTSFECKLLGKLARQEQTIAELEDKLAGSSIQEQILEAQVGEYKSLLRDIQSLIDGTKA